MIMLLKIGLKILKDIERENNILKKRCEYFEHHDLEMFLKSISDVIHDYNE